jgi:hypothetical protein
MRFRIIRPALVVPEPFAVRQHSVVGFRFERREIHRALPCTQYIGRLAALDGKQQKTLLPVPGCPVAFAICFSTALIRTFPGTAIPALPFEVIHASFSIDPYNRVFWAMLPGSLFAVELWCGLRVNRV